MKRFRSRRTSISVYQVFGYSLLVSFLQTSSSLVVTTSNTASSIISEVASPDTTATLTLVPLSSEPLLLSSSSPLLDPHECNDLIEYLELTQNRVTGKHDAFTAQSIQDGNNDHVQIKNEDEMNIFLQGQRLLSKVIEQANSLTNCSYDPNEVILPRILQPSLLQTEDNDYLTNRQTILPDSLHLDNVNEKSFRHISAILYLTEPVGKYNTDEVSLLGGATTFPLARPYYNDSSRDNCLSADSTTATTKEKCNRDDDWWYERTELAAQRLIKSKIYHTNIDGWQSEGAFVDQTGVDLFHKETRGPNDVLQSGGAYESNRGVRVQPEKGKLCVFHNLTPEGTPDPMVFHGAEAVIGKKTENKSKTISRSDDGSNSKKETFQVMTKKRVALVFFKEIPRLHDTDHSAQIGIDEMKHIAEKASDARNWFLERYY